MPLECIHRIIGMAGLSARSNRYQPTVWIKMPLASLTVLQKIEINHRGCINVDSIQGGIALGTSSRAA